MSLRRYHASIVTAHGHRQDFARASVEAGGGLVVRRGDSGAEVVVIHRPRHDDWSFPKGKLEAGETFEEAAVREVEEETGLRCRLCREVPSVRYRDASGRSKIVRYWLMEVEEGTIDRRRSDDEVDDVRWLKLEEARRHLTYEHDRALVSEIV